jgi:glycosyltransferase involved in cell wall biosynthesis
MEAMACGTAVIAARSSSLPEIAGGAALLVDPLDIGEMRDGLEAVLGRAALRDELRSKGLQRARYFTWERAAERVKEVLAGAGDKNPLLFPSV